ncbi:Asp/Glu racemase [Luteimicrobium album]|uniref:Asp/Glu racemase n=1 Tax=Luteimicrobium album TaxID=1054550 RepID=A0ABQ6HV43_9MICO|nr:aspartate/glutamate racemase family protein [Luteimicrobium album]GMA22393.1 Asp/Glu racemase [Luteimicrobium album]
MRIRVVNPNTTRAMTDLVGRSARAVAFPGTTVEAVQPTMGPASIESHYEEALAVPGILEQVALAEALPPAERPDAYVLACFGDPGLDAARELASGPVVGIAEAAMHAATLVGRRFAVVTSLGRTVARARELAARYGFAEACVAVHACELPVLELDRPGSQARETVTEYCRLAAAADDVDAVVLGCAGMASLCREIGAEIGVPVVDGVAAATTLAQSLVALGLSTSRAGEYAPPPPSP